MSNTTEWNTLTRKILFSKATYQSPNFYQTLSGIFPQQALLLMDNRACYNPFIDALFLPIFTSESADLLYRLSGYHESIHRALSLTTPLKCYMRYLNGISQSFILICCNTDDPATVLPSIKYFLSNIPHETPNNNPIMQYARAAKEAEDLRNHYMASTEILEELTVLLLTMDAFKGIPLDRNIQNSEIEERIVSQYQQNKTFPSHFTILYNKSKIALRRMSDMYFIVLVHWVYCIAPACINTPTLANIFTGKKTNWLEELKQTNIGEILLSKYETLIDAVLDSGLFVGGLNKFQFDAWCSEKTRIPLRVLELCKNSCLVNHIETYAEDISYIEYIQQNGFIKGPVPIDPLMLPLLSTSRLLRNCCLTYLLDDNDRNVNPRPSFRIDGNTEEGLIIPEYGYLSDKSTCYLILFLESIRQQLLAREGYECPFSVCLRKGCAEKDNPERCLWRRFIETVFLNSHEELVIKKVPLCLEKKLRHFI